MIGLRVASIIHRGSWDFNVPALIPHCRPREVVKPIHEKATPLILSAHEEIEAWLIAPAEEALKQRPANVGVITLLPEDKDAA